MADKPINLNRARKERARDAAKKQADENAVKHGRTKAERDLAAARRAQSIARLEGHKKDE